MKFKIRKGDTVEVISGADLHKRGEVIRVDRKDERVVVQGVSVHKKHQKQVQTQGRNMNPGIIEFESPIHVSNVMLVCPKCDEPTRIGLRRDAEGNVERICKRCQSVID